MPNVLDVIEKDKPAPNIEALMEGKIYGTHSFFESQGNTSSTATELVQAGGMPPGQHPSIASPKDGEEVWFFGRLHRWNSESNEWEFTGEEDLLDIESETIPEHLLDPLFPGMAYPDTP